jgi:hypothetical protein
MAKPKGPPRLWKSSFMWIAAALLGFALAGFLRGDAFIRDPGQTDEPFLAWMYVAGAAVMVFNGWLTHLHALREWREAQED